MAELKELRPADLLIDQQNPRIGQPNSGQNAALQALAKNQERKLLQLARDIVAHSLNPAELMIVTPDKDDLNRHVVLEGNRRLAALKALENPEILAGVLPSSMVVEMRRLSRQYQESPIEELQCVVMDREEAGHWIQLKHTGENQGAGIVEWGADEQARFKSRAGSLPPIGQQVLNYLQGRGDLSPDARTAVPTASLGRLLGTPEVRAKAGLDWKDGKLFVQPDQEQVSKALLHIIDDLVSQRIKTQDIYTAPQRRDYADSLPKTVSVERTAQSGRGIDVSLGAIAPPTGGPRSATSRNVRIQPLRDKLIPRDCTLNVVEIRLRTIERELRLLSLEYHTNAVSVLLRVFVELSVDSYIERIGLTLPDERASLGTKLKVTMDSLVSKKMLTSQQAKPVRRALQADSFLSPSVTSMHEYIHNQHYIPVPSDLRAHWDGLQPFIAAIWAP